MRQFRYRDDTSDKFWNIDVANGVCTVHFGRVGTKGQQQTKTFPTPEEAHTYATKQISGKQKKGYTELGAEIVSDEEAFHRALQANPHDLAGWVAFADFLLERDDPRGAFMQVQIALEDTTLDAQQRTELREQEEALLQTHQREWLGELAPLCLDRDAFNRPPAFKHTFMRGWLHSLEPNDVTRQQMAVLGRCPEARHLLRFVVPTCRQADALDDCPTLRNVRELVLGVHPTHANFPYRSTCDVNLYRLLPQVPFLETFGLYNGSRLWSEYFAHPMPHLQNLEFLHHDNDDYTKLTQNATLQNLRTLHIYPGIHPDDDRTGQYLRLRQLQTICHGPHFQNLQHLTMRQSDFGDDSAQALAESGLLGRLKSLHLYDGRLTNDGAATLAKCPGFRKLEWFYLECFSIPNAGAELLRATDVDMEIRVLERPLDDDEDDGHDRSDRDADDFYDDDWE